MLSVHYGSNKEAIPRCWALADKEKFKNGLKKVFLEFLETCYCKYNTSGTTGFCINNFRSRFHKFYLRVIGCGWAMTIVGPVMLIS